MKNLFVQFGNLTSRIFDFFYPPFGKYLKMNIRLYRYAMSGSVNVVFGWILFYVIYNFILDHKNLDLGFFTFSSHIASLAITSPIALFSGFILQKYVTFTESELRGKTQLIRYLIVFAINATINYAGLKLLVDYYGYDGTPSQMFMTIVCILFSYISQHFFTFKTINKKE